LAREMMNPSMASGQNEYGAVSGEPYCKFGIISYRQVPAPKFDENLGW
jgi:hypothetical protein